MWQGVKHSARQVQFEARPTCSCPRPCAPPRAQQAKHACTGPAYPAAAAPGGGSRRRPARRAARRAGTRTAGPAARWARAAGGPRRVREGEKVQGSAEPGTWELHDETAASRLLAAPGPQCCPGDSPVMRACMQPPARTPCDPAAHLPRRLVALLRQRDVATIGEVQRAAVLLRVQPRPQEPQVPAQGSNRKLCRLWVGSTEVGTHSTQSAKVANRGSPRVGVPQKDGLLAHRPPASPY